MSPPSLNEARLVDEGHMPGLRVVMMVPETPRPYAGESTPLPLEGVCDGK